MSETTEQTDDLHGRLLANEALTFALLAMLTHERSDRAEIIHNVIAATDAIIAGLPGEAGIEQQRKGWARTHWNSRKPLFAQLIHIDPTNGLRQ